VSRPRKFAGYLAERSGRILRTVPGVLGALLVSYGLFLAWLPLGVIAAGGFLLLVDRRVP
jgi:energy-converting hydrogenase Eha subunit G